MSPFTANLLVNAAATGPVVQWPGGVATFACNGTFGGATITLKYLMPDGTYQAVGASTTVTALAVVNGVYLPAGAYQAVITAGPPSAMYASLVASLN